MHRELDRRRINIVRRLAQVHVAVGTDDVVSATVMTHELQCTVRDYLIRVHIRRRAGSALDHVDLEVAMMFSLSQLAARVDDRLGDRGAEQSEVAICFRGCFLYRSDSNDESGEIANSYCADGEVLNRTQRLYSKQSVVRNLAFAEEIVLEPGIAWCHSVVENTVIPALTGL